MKKLLGKLLKTPHKKTLRILKERLQLLLLLYYSIPIFCFKRNEGGLNMCMSQFCKSVSRYTQDYCLIDLRPKTSELLGDNIFSIDCSDLAIIIQGQIDKYEFTKNTIEIYKKIFPNATIIVSTWKTTDSAVIEDLRTIKVHVVLSELPEICGLGNVNYQICSSRAGLEYAKNLGLKYSMKTRTDQCVYDSLSFLFLKEIMDKYPSANKVGQQKSRIISVNGFWGQMFAPFWIQDFFFFGLTIDLYRYFDADYDNRNYHRLTDYMRENSIETMSLEERVDIKVPEVYLTHQFMKKENEDFGKQEMTIESFWECIKERFFVIERSDIKLYWNKYDAYKEYLNNGHYKFNKKLERYEQTLNLKNSIGIINGDIKPPKTS